eukprot:gene13768-biopygen10425
MLVQVNGSMRQRRPQARVAKAARARLALACLFAIPIGRYLQYIPFTEPGWARKLDAPRAAGRAALPTGGAGVGWGARRHHCASVRPTGWALPAMENTRGPRPGTFRRSAPAPRHRAAPPLRGRQVSHGRLRARVSRRLVAPQLRARLPSIMLYDVALWHRAMTSLYDVALWHRAMTSLYDVAL